MGKIVIFSAPSGAGKTTLVKYLLESNLNLEFSVSATNRPPREGEVHGKDYYFLDTASFRHHIEADDFLEWEEVYENCYYGTLKSELQRIWNNQHHVLFDIDVQGGLNLKKQYGDKALAVFVTPPSFEVLRERLSNRQTESKHDLETRVQKARKEMQYADRFDIILINDRLEEARQQAYNIVRDFFSSISKLG